MALAVGGVASVQPIGNVATLLDRLLQMSAGAPVALGIDAPIGLPRAYAALHCTENGFPAFLRSLADRPAFLDVADDISEAGPSRPFFPHRGRRGMTRLSLAEALGLPSASELSRACDRATPERPAGAPLFWTLGANQSGRSAISAWRGLLLPQPPPLLWPFDGPLRSLLRPGRVAIAETYPAEALRQLGLRLAGSKRRQSDRQALAPALAACLRQSGVIPDDPLSMLIGTGFGADPAGEDRLDCVLGLLCVLGVLAGDRPDTAPADPWIQRWEGWVLGQTDRAASEPRAPRSM